MYSNFVMRLHNENASASSWELSVGANVAGTFSVFKLGNVVVPNPPAKTDSEDIPGTNGLYDLSEARGRVYYTRRTITVPLLFIAGKTWTDTLETTLARYNGRVCDFAFSTYDAVAWIYTGRLTVTKNRAENNVVLTFDAEPFAVAADYTEIDVPASASVDSSSFGWTFDRAIGGSQIATNNTAGKFAFSASDIGTEIRYKRTGLTPGDSYTLGVKSIVGGSIAFLNSEVENLTEGIVDSNGVLTVKIVVDGSHYTWETVNNTVSSYPSFRCEYILAKMVYGESSIMLPSNCVIRPNITNSSAKAYLILDGVVFGLDNVIAHIQKPPGAIMPGSRADKSASSAKCIYVCVPQTTGTPYMTMRFRKQEAI